PRFACWKRTGRPNSRPRRRETMRSNPTLLAILVSVIGSTAWAQAATPLPGGDTPPAPPPVEEKVAAPAAPAVTPAPGTAQPQETPTLERFQQVLAPHGRWVQTAQYGLVWVPNVSDPSWRPYTNGRWVYTDAGWTFVSADPWGW